MVKLMQIEKGHKFTLIMCHMNVEDLLDIHKYGCGPFCVSLLTDRHLKGLARVILFTFSKNWRFFMSARLMWYQTSHAGIESAHSTYVTSPNYDVLNVIIDLLLAKQPAWKHFEKTCIVRATELERSFFTNNSVIIVSATMETLTRI